MGSSAPLQRNKEDENEVFMHYDEVEDIPGQLNHLGTYTFLSEVGQLYGYRQTSVLPEALWEGQRKHLDQPAARDSRDYLKQRVEVGSIIEESTQ